MIPSSSSPSGALVGRPRRLLGRRQRRRPSAPSTSRRGVAASRRPRGRALTIYGAASLKSALDQVKTAYEASHPGTTLTISTDSSAALETQIEQGAPADVFLSADTTNPKKLVDKGLADGPAGELRRQPADGHRPDGQPGRRSRRPPTSRSRASRSSPPATTCRSRSTRSSSSRTSRRSRLPGRLRGRLRREHRLARRTTSRRDRGQDRAGRGRRRDRLRDRREGIDKVTPIDVPTSANVPATYAGVVVKASAHPARGHGVPRLGRRPRRPGGPRRLRVPAAAMTDGGWGARAGRSGPAGIGRARAGMWPSALWPSSRALPRPAGHRPRRPGDPRRIAARSPSRAGRHRALCLSLVTTAISLVVTVALATAARASSSPGGSSAARARRGDRRPADRAAAVGRRAGAAPGLRAARALSARRSQLFGISLPFTTSR